MKRQLYTKKFQRVAVERMKSCKDVGEPTVTVRGDVGDWLKTNAHQSVLGFAPHVSTGGNLAPEIALCGRRTTKQHRLTTPPSEGIKLCSQCGYSTSWFGRATDSMAGCGHFRPLFRPCELQAVRSWTANTAEARLGFPWPAASAQLSTRSLAANSGESSLALIKNTVN